MNFMSLKKVIDRSTWYWTCIFIIFSVVANFCMVNVAKKIEQIIGQMTEMKSDDFMKIILSAGFFCAFYVIFNFGYWFMYNCVVKKAIKLATEYTYSNYLIKKLDYFSGRGAGDIVYSVVCLAGEIGTHYATFWPMLFVNAITLIILFATIASYNILFSIFVMLSICLLIFLTSFISKKLADKTLASENLAANINSRMVQNFQGISIIKVFRRENYFADKYRRGLSEQKYKNDVVRDFWYSLYVVIYGAMTIIFPIVVLLAGFWMREKNLVSVGAVVAIYSIVGLMQEPMRELADSVTLYKENINREKKLGSIVEPYFGEKIVPSMEKIVVKITNLEMGGKKLAEDIGFEIERGDIIALQGPSGCGKSTILKLIIGFIECDGCECYYDGILQDEISDEMRYANISLVERKPFLFTASIKENIILGEEFEPELLQEVLKVCMLEEMVRQYGLEKEIDWAGGNVSGGEMQRITIARTIIRKPRFLLLDEVTASLDARTAEAVAENIVIFAKKYDIAIVAVSHKEEFVRLSNKKVGLLILKKGGQKLEDQEDYSE